MNRSSAGNLGIGEYDEEDRAYSTENNFHNLRVQHMGPLGRRAFTRTRLQYSWNDSELTSAVELPTIRVNDSFTRGGAQVAGGQHSRSIGFGTDLDYVRGIHTLRTGISLDGAEVCVVGYGELVGAPLSIMLAQDSIRGNATVTITHVRTKDLGEHTKRADILVAAAGFPEMITGDMVKPGATVLDVGVHRTERGMVGDVKFDEVSQVAGAITPVPGGVGPMTVAMLMVNTVTAAELATYRP